MRIVKEVKAQGRHPLQITVLSWFILSCVGQLFIGPAPGGIHIDSTTQKLLIVLLLLSSILTLAGSLIRDILGFSFELFGWVGIVVAFGITTCYIVAADADPAATAAGVFFPVFIVGGVWRIIQIRRAQKRLDQIKHHQIEPLP